MGAFDPVPYSAYLAPPPSPTAPLDQLQNEQMVAAQRSMLANQYQQQLRTQQLQNAALQDAITNPSPQAYRNLLLVNPAAHDAIKAAYDGLDTETQRQQLQAMTAVGGYLDAGQPDKAQAIVQQHIDAAKKAGQDTTSYQSISDLINSNPKYARALVGMTLAGTAGADKMAQTQASLGQEARASAEFPLDVQAKQADINLKNAQAQEVGQGTAVNPATGAYYNPKAAPPTAAASTGNGALDGIVAQIQADENSTGNPGAKNPNSSATGNGQFINSTWLQMVKTTRPDLAQGKSDADILALRSNPAIAAQMTSAYAQANAQKLRQANLPVNGATIAMAHRLGPQGAQAVLQAQANTPLSQILPPDVIQANPQYAKMTAGQLGEQLAQRYGTAVIDTNPGDPNASGEDFLRSLSPARAALVKSIAEGLQPGPTGRSAASGPGQFLMQQVQQYDPTATSINLPVRQATRKAFTSGTQGQSIVQANTVGGHLAALDALADTLGNTGIPFVNTVKNATGAALGNQSTQKAVTSFNTLSNTLASELTKFYRNNGGSEQDVNEFRRQLNASNSPTQIHSAIKEMASAVLSKIDALNTSYNQGMGKVTDGINLPNLNQNALGQLQRLAGEGPSPAASLTQQVYVNPKTGQRIVSDGAGGWKPA